MKKALSLILALVLCLSLCACGGSTEETPTQTTTEPIETTIPEETTEPIETTIPEETTEPAPASCWDIDYYVDAFGDPTGESYMVAVVDGTFSNTATMGSDLKVIIYCENDVFSFRLLEYGDIKATYTSYDDITIQIKDAWGASDIYQLYGTSPNGDIYDYEEYISLGILQAVKVNDIDVPTIITIGSSTYKFTIPCGGFDAVYEEYKNMD